MPKSFFTIYVRSYTSWWIINLKLHGKSWKKWLRLTIGASFFFGRVGGGGKKVATSKNKICQTPCLQLSLGLDLASVHLHQRGGGEAVPISYWPKVNVTSPPIGRKEALPISYWLTDLHALSDWPRDADSGLRLAAAAAFPDLLLAQKFFSRSFIGPETSLPDLLLADEFSTRCPIGPEILFPIFYWPRNNSSWSSIGWWALLLLSYWPGNVFSRPPIGWTVFLLKNPFLVSY